MALQHYPSDGVVVVPHIARTPLKQLITQRLARGEMGEKSESLRGLTKRGVRAKLRLRLAGGTAMRRINTLSLLIAGLLIGGIPCAAQQGPAGAPGSPGPAGAQGPQGRLEALVRRDRL